MTTFCHAPEAMKRLFRLFYEMFKIALIWRLPGTVLASWAWRGGFRFLPGWCGVSPLKTPMSPASTWL